MATAKKAGMAAGVEVASISVKVSPDTKLFRAKLQDELNEIERTMRGEVNIEANLNTAKAQLDYEKLKAKLEKNKIKIGVTYDKDRKPGAGGGGGGRGGGIGVPDLPGGGKRGGSMDSLIPSFGSGINPAGYVAILTAVVALAGPLLGLITTALLSLPGVISLIGAPIAAITLGLDGFKKAAEAIKPQFDRLKQTMSDVAQTAFTPVLQRVADEIFPKLEASLPSVTRGLAEFAQGAVDAFKNDGGKFEASVNRIGDAFSAMRPGMDGFTSGFIGLIDQFTLKLPSITKWFNETGEDFKNWVKKISEDGSLSKAFDGLGETITTLLDTLGGLALDGFEFIKDPKNMDGFIASLKEFGNALTDISNLSTTLAPIWDMINALGKIPSISSLLPGGSKEPNKGPGIGVVDGTPVPEGTPPPAGDQGASETATAWQGLPAIIDGVIATIKAKVAGMWETIKTEATIQIGQLGTNIATDITTAFTFMITALPALVGSAVGQMIGALITGGVKMFGELATWGAKAMVAVGNLTGTLASKGMELAGGFMESIATKALEIWADLGTWPGKALEAVGDMSSTLINAGFQLVQGFINGFQKKAGEALQIVKDWAGKLGPAVEWILKIFSPSRVFMGIGENTAAGMGVGLENGFGPVLEQARGLTSKISGIFASGGDPTTALAGYKSKEVDAMQSVLGLQSRYISNQIKQLDLQAKLAGKGPAADGFKAQADALRSQKDAWDTQREMVDIAQEFEALKNPKKGDKSSGNVFLDAINEFMKIPNAFGGATANQAMQDLNISGNGALESVVGYGMDFAKKGVTNIFNTSNVADTLSAHFGVTQRQALGVDSR